MNSPRPDFFTSAFPNFFRPHRRIKKSAKFFFLKQEPTRGPDLPQIEIDARGF